MYAQTFDKFLLIVLRMPLLFSFNNYIIRRFFKWRIGYRKHILTVITLCDKKCNNFFMMHHLSLLKFEIVKMFKLGNIYMMIRSYLYICHFHFHYLI